MASVKTVRRSVESGSVVNVLGSLMRDWLSTALGKFDRDASRYHAAVYQKKRTDLLTSLHVAVSPLFLGQLKNLHKILAAQFVKHLSSGLKEPGYDFAEVVSRLEKHARKSFLEGAEG